MQIGAGRDRLIVRGVHTPEGGPTADVNACARSRAPRAGGSVRDAMVTGDHSVTCVTSQKDQISRPWPLAAIDGKHRAIRTYSRKRMITGLTDRVRYARYGVNKE